MGVRSKHSKTINNMRVNISHDISQIASASEIRLVIVQDPKILFPLISINIA